MKTLVRNSADTKQVKAAGQKEELRGEREINDLKSIMSTVYGRRFVRRQIIEVAGLYRSSYLGSPTGRVSDPAFLEGMRNIALQQYAEVLEHCPEEWALAEKEHRETLRTEGRTDDRSRNDDSNNDDNDA